MCSWYYIKQYNRVYFLHENTIYCIFAVPFPSLAKWTGSGIHYRHVKYSDWHITPQTTKDGLLEVIIIHKSRFYQFIDEYIIWYVKSPWRYHEGGKLLSHNQSFSVSTLYLTHRWSLLSSSACLPFTVIIYCNMIKSDANWIDHRNSHWSSDNSEDLWWSIAYFRKGVKIYWSTCQCTPPPSLPKMKLPIDCPIQNFPIPGQGDILILADVPPPPNKGWKSWISG